MINRRITWLFFSIIMVCVILVDFGLFYHVLLYKITVCSGYASGSLSVFSSLLSCSLRPGFGSSRFTSSLHFLLFPMPYIWYLLEPKKDIGRSGGICIIDSLLWTERVFPDLSFNDTSGICPPRSVCQPVPPCRLTYPVHWLFLFWYHEKVCSSWTNLFLHHSCFSCPWWVKCLFSFQRVLFFETVADSFCRAGY